MRQYVAGPPGPPGPPGTPGIGSYILNTHEVAEHVLGLMNGECYKGTHGLPIKKGMLRERRCD